MNNEQNPPLPFTPIEGDDKQKQLTTTFLITIQDEIFDLLMEIRAEIDPILIKRHPSHFGKPYPLGRCLEITDAVRDSLARRLRHPRSRAERALEDFIRQGGVVRPLWGALRDRYFQNASQFGSLYIDVSNDTVSFMKPKVEILPIEHSGITPIRDLAHFRHIAQQYWGMTFFPNFVAPTLAPLLPMISLNAHSELRFESPGVYMVELTLRDAFRDAESWLEQSPAPPPAVMDTLSAALPPDLRLPPGEDARAAAVTACRLARQEGCHLDPTWRRARLADYQRFMDGAINRTAG